MCQREQECLVRSRRVSARALPCQPHPLSTLGRGHRGASPTRLLGRARSCSPGMLCLLLASLCEFSDCDISIWH